MTPEHLLDHALGQLEGPDLQRAEAALAADPALADRHARLARGLDRLLDDGESDLEPPADLTARALARVAASQPALRRRTLADYIPQAVPFRWADVAVAASIFVAGLLTLVPALQTTRMKMAQAGCVSNLQQLGTALFQYAGHHEYFPHVADGAGATEAGMVPVLLREGGLIRDRSLLRCPCNHHGGPRAADAGEIPDMDTARDLREVDPERYRRLISADYAYNAGHMGPGRVEGLHCRVEGFHPLLADQPPHDGVAVHQAGNSFNHAGRGQNVLFVNGSIKWFPGRSLGPHDPDMFLNAELLPGPCRLPDDSALIPYFCRLTGF